MIKVLDEGKVIGYTTEDSGGVGVRRSTTNRFKNHPMVHVATSNAYDSDESRQNIKDIWIENMISAIEGNPNNVWK